MGADKRALHYSRAVCVNATLRPTPDNTCDDKECDWLRSACIHVLLSTYRNGSLPVAQCMDL